MSLVYPKHDNNYKKKLTVPRTDSKQQTFIEKKTCLMIFFIIIILKPKKNTKSE